MRRGLPRIVRGRTSAKSPNRRSWTRSDRKLEEQQALPIYTRLPDRDKVSPARPPRILEAHLHANVDVLPKKPFKLGPDEGRPTGRQVPTGTVTHLPNAYTGHGRKRYDLSPIPVPRSTIRRKPSFRRVDLAQTDTYESFMQSGHRVLSHRLAGENNRLLRSTYRRLFSISSAPVASSSSVRIEDLDAMDLQAYQDSQARLHQTGGLLIERHDEIGLQRQEEGAHSPAQSKTPQSQEHPRLEKPADRRRRKELADPQEYIHGARMNPPENPAHMIGILSQAVRTVRVRKLEILQQLSAWHERYADMRTTASFNILLQYAYDLRNLRAFNQILNFSMPRAGIKKDRVSWDIEMESYARHGMWKKVVETWTERREAGVPLTPIGWTRMAQAVTKRGTTSLNTEDIGTSMSPIYSALYDLPKGVRQLQLHKLTMHQKMDVDQMLALMMPDDLKPMDFHATLAVAHRLAKQVRWREAEDVVALYLDRSSETWEAQMAGSVGNGANGAISRHSGRGLNRKSLESQTAAVSREAGRRQQSALALLHVLLECLVISRSSPEMLHAYIENFVIRYENTHIKPEYHTLFFVLSAYRVQPLETRFTEAYEMFTSLEESYRPSRIGRTDRFGLSRCLRQLTTYASLTLKAYSGDLDKKELCRSTRAALANIEARLLELVVEQNEQSSRQEHERRMGVARQPRNHVVFKEKYKALGKPARRKLDRVEQQSKSARNVSGIVTETVRVEAV